MAWIDAERVMLAMKAKSEGDKWERSSEAKQDAGKMPALQGAEKKTRRPRVRKGSREGAGVSCMVPDTK
jgi:hypothetical protein